MENRKNKNRGYQQLRVWKDAGNPYILTCRVFRKFPFDLKRIVSQQIASVDSVQRSIAEGYCRRTINEYLQYLIIARASLGESISSAIIYHKAEHITAEEFEQWDKLSYKLENGLIKLIESLEIKRKNKDWDNGRA